MRTAGSLHSRASWVLLWGLRQPEKLMVGPCWEAAPGSIPEWGAVLAFLLPPISEVSLSRDAQYRACCKSCYRGKELWCCSKIKKGKSDSAENKYLFDVCVCSSPRAAGQFLGALNTYCLEMPFHFHSLPSASHAEGIKPHHAWKSDLSISSVACNYYLLLKIEDWTQILVSWKVGGSQNRVGCKSGPKWTWSAERLCIQLWKCHTVPS